MSRDKPSGAYGGGDHFWDRLIIQTNDKHSVTYATNGCSIPKLDPFDESIRSYLDKPTPLVCNSTLYLIYQMDNGTLAFNESLLRIMNIKESTIQCFSQEVIRKNGDGAITMSFEHILEPPTRPTFDFISVKCYRNGTKKMLFHHIFTNIAPESVHRETPVEDESPHHMSVILFCIDSASRSSAIRRLPKTMEILKDLKAYDFKGHVKVGENTLPNMIPLLTGLNVSELPAVKTFDSVSFLWNNYSSNGYATFYAEDKPEYDTFNYRFRGFKNPPTDHYMRPFQLKLREIQKKAYPHINEFCYNGKSRHSTQINYLKQFLSRYKKKRRFAVSMISVLCHDNEHNLQHGDTDLSEFVLWVKGEEHLKNTALLIFGDHGQRISNIRRTSVGYLEDRMPLLQILMPDDFKKRFSRAHTSLLTNTQRLTTHFDLYRTLTDILEQKIMTPSSSLNKGKTRGISLFKDIPSTRTCEDALIPVKYCVCGSTAQESATTSLARTLAKTGVKRLNKFVSTEESCAILALHNITSVRKYIMALDDTNMPKNTLSPIVGSSASGRYIVQFLTTPGFGMFEATFSVYSDDSVHVNGNIDRINVYGNQSACIREKTLLQKYCYCVKIYDKHTMQGST
ncbi:hypothetical protein MAR_015898 [Mya arenaria]|uniref:Uncharacterized protein n=1 Tax=Mya arenaria TaxID=6604 RepID=A0ABY7FL70_MYAAR|nr:hypothetical protein MAR_015898 [Mya arenaria]